VIELFANIFMLREDFSDDANELNKTLGKIPIIFSDNQEVISCYKRKYILKKMYFFLFCFLLKVLYDMYESIKT